MLKDVCITPQAFNGELLVDSALWKDIKNLLDTLLSSGYIIGLHNNDWLKSIRTEINQTGNQKVKDLLNNLISSLKDRNRIVGHPKQNAEVPNSEKEWLFIVDGLNHKQQIYAIFTSKPFSDNMVSIEQLENKNIVEEYGITGSKHSVKTRDELEKIFRPFLSYARKVTVIDPYFDISEKRYKITLDLIAKHFRNKRGEQTRGTILISCSTKIEISKDWIAGIKKIYDDYGHIVQVSVWDRKDDGLKQHDRYIITDQAGIVSAAGTDEDNYQQSEWAIKDYVQLDEILRQYKENSSPYALSKIVTANGVETR